MAIECAFVRSVLLHGTSVNGITWLATPYSDYLVSITLFNYSNAQASSYSVWMSTDYDAAKQAAERIIV
jgi:hypothetical protein